LVIIVPVVDQLLSQYVANVLICNVGKCIHWTS